MSSGIKSYRDLLIWRKGIELVKEVYGLTRRFPRHETFALASQLQRSVVSVPSNIAEGQARQHIGEFRQFLYTALGSLAEVDTQIVIAHELSYISSEEADSIQKRVTELQKMIHTLISRLPK